ncbi:hypothetical protein Tco_1163899 [Tanacetum coccineum]
MGRGVSDWRSGRWMAEIGPPISKKKRGFYAYKETSPSPETHQGNRRKCPATDDATGETSLNNQLIEAMERNGILLSTQLKIQNNNSQLDREQRRDHANSLFEVLNKLADVMVRIADKL